jgi:YidC/Oxa1 family membrane protein insertase
MEKRTLLAIVLSLAVFSVWTYFFSVPPTKPVQTLPQAQMSTARSDAGPVTEAVKVPKLLPAAAVKEIMVETEDYTAVFSSQGGALKRFVLKKYTETTDPHSKAVTLVAEDNAENFALQSAAAGFGLERGALYHASSDGFKLGRGENQRLEFTLTSPQGIFFKKVYTFSGNNYGIGLTCQLTNGGSQPLTGTLQTAFPYRTVPLDKFSRFEANGAVTVADDKLHADKIEKLAKEAKKYDTNILWSGFADKYFLSAVMAERDSIRAVNIQNTPRNYVESIISSPPATVNPGETVTVAYGLYFGPKDLDIMKAQGHGLERSLDLGWFSVIAKPLLSVLKFFYKYVHNYGLAIIIITLIIKVLFIPLTHKSYTSMKDMQKLQPKMAELKEKHKNDKEAMNKAMFELYRTHKVNPLGGCLPMLIQFPVFIALYNALMYSIELRHSPFMFWIHDLAAKDPYYITPIIMGGTMFIQQRMTPTNMDPVQAKMMMFLPVVFTVMFLNFPAGLVLYWMVNNILTIAQQYYINKLVKE